MSEEKQARPWLRMKGESTKAYNRFQTYLHMLPAERSFMKVAVELQCSERNIAYYASRWHWSARVDAYDRHQDELNFARFEKMRARAARRRMERELQRQEEAENVADLLVERARVMLSWPIQEETVTERTEITDDGQTSHITNRIVKPVKWNMMIATRVVEALDRMRRASVEDLTEAQPVEHVAPSEIAERHFILHTAEQVQMPVVPERPLRL